MTTSNLTETIVRVVTEEFARVWGERLGGEPTTAPSADARGVGWIVTVPITGAASGRLVVWADREAAAASTRQALALDRDPEENEVAGFLRELVTVASTAAAGKPELSAVGFAEPAVRQGVAPSALQTTYLAIANTASAVVGVGIDAAPAAAAPADGRLDAVLDVDLPLTVRFGRAIMPLRSIVDLGPGSVVDMGRSPDEPVELLVGDRIVARGEVVVVSGNYGLRITELVGPGENSTGMEARLA
jgi:flagellar motor switch protein FliN/FliY